MINIRGFLSKNKLLLIYGFSLALLLLLLRLLEWHFLIMAHSMEIYIGAIALLFTGLGIWLALKLSKPKIETVVIEKIVEVEVEKEKPAEPFLADEKVINKLGISKRELEVLQLMSEGLSNQEIAGRLFVSLNTVKTHSSRLFEKMEVKRRTQAVEMGKRLTIIQ